MAKEIKLTLDCGVIANQYIFDGWDRIEISLKDLLNGGGELSDFNKLSILFKELHDKGYKNRGLSVEYGWYDAVENLILDVDRELPKF